MAASVLGKRHRQATIVEDSVPPLRSQKRRAIGSTPQIYSDSDALSKTKTPQDAGSHMDLDDLRPNHNGTIRPTVTRNVLSKHTVQSRHPTVTSNEVTTVSALSEPVTGEQCAAARDNDVDNPPDENVPPALFKTPTTTRFKDVFSNAGLKTPRHLVRITGRPLTPRTPRTLSTPTPKIQTVYALARDLFSQSTGPRKLIGRDTERTELRSFISNAIKSKKGGCIYISGPPGTGKSALVDEVSAEFKVDPSIKVANLNCVAVKSAKEVYSKLIQDFRLDCLSVNASEKDHLGNMFIPKKKAGSAAYLVLLDEIDSLLDGECKVLYSLFEWALHRSSRLILIGIANALDLTDRFLPRLKAQNLKPRLMPFLPYTAAQIASIVTEMLRSTLPAKSTAAPDFVPFLHPTAIQLSSKKVASQTGDIRKVFSLVRRAIDQIEREAIEKTAAVTPSPVKQPLTEIPNLPMTLPATPPCSSPLEPISPQVLSIYQSLDNLTPETAPRATVAHIARLTAGIFNNGAVSRVAGLNLQQKAILCSLIASERKNATRDPFMTPTKSAGKAPAVKDLYAMYSGLCTRNEGILQPLKRTEFRDVVASLEMLGLIQESTGRMTTFLTPTKTLSRMGTNPDERHVISAISDKEMFDGLKGAEADLLQRLIHEA